MNCKCACGCQNLLTIDDRSTICDQCWRGSHAKPVRDLKDLQALADIERILHDSICGKVPGYQNSDLFESHDKVAEAILAILKANAF